MIHIGKKRYIAFLSGRKNIEGVPPYGEIPYFAFLDIRPYQYGWESCKPLHSFGPFVRNHYLFHFIISRRGMLYSHSSNGEIHEYSLEANQGFLICPGQINLYTADEKDPWKYVWIEFDGMHAEECLLRAGLEQDRPIYRPRSIEEGALLQKRMFYFSEHSGKSSIHLVGCLYLFLDELIEFSGCRQDIGEKSRKIFISMKQSSISNRTTAAN